MEQSQQVVKRTDMPLAERGLVPQSVSELFRLAKALVQGGIAPKGMSEHQCVGTMLFGLELGMRVIQSLNSIAFINNRPSIWGKGARALLLTSGEMAALPEEFFEGSGDNLTAVCRMKRRGMPGVAEGRFSWADAKRMGLTGKDTYRKDPKGMLSWRAWHRAAMKGFSDVLMGLWVREVARDVPAEDAEVKVYALPPQDPADKTAAPVDVLAPSFPAPAPEAVELPPEPEPVAAPAPVATEAAPEPPAQETYDEEKVPLAITYDETKDLWDMWMGLRPKLSPEHLAHVRERAGVQRIAPNMTAEKLNAVIVAAESLLGC